MSELEKLREPFKPDEIEWRVGSTTADKSRGLALAYMDARAVMERLDSVCGPENWQCRYTHANSKTVCEIGIRVVEPTEGKTWEWVWKADGAGDTDFEAEKGALSDAFKRAAVRWGIGRYLYDLPAKWVPIEQKGRSYAISDGALEGLRASLSGKKTNDPVGPLTSGLPKTKLQEAIRNLLHDLYECEDLDSFEGMLKDNEAVYEQCKRDFPIWFYGDPKDKDKTGLEQRVNDIRKALMQLDAQKQAEKV